MKIFLLSPFSVPLNPVLFPTMIKTWENAGHHIVDNIVSADCIFVDLHTRIADYKQSDVDYILSNTKPVVTWDEYDKGGMSDLEWPSPLTEQQADIFFHLLQPIKQVHFCRLLNKNKEYHPSIKVYPYEKPILHQEPIVSVDDLFNRDYDIVWIANTAPQREILAKALREDGRLKCNIRLGEKKIPYHEWIAEHKKGKLFISCSAGGYSNECVQSLFSISGHLRERTDQLLLHPFTHLANCLETDASPTKEDLDTIVQIVNDKDRLYEIYLNCIDHMNKYYSEEYLANYVLEKLKENGIG